MKFDLHGYDPRTIAESGILQSVVQQAWEMGEQEVVFVHGHALWRGTPRPFANTNTGRLGLAVRGVLRRERELRRWMYAKLDASWPGTTTVWLKRNPAPTRSKFDFSVLPDLDFKR